MFKTCLENRIILQQKRYKCYLCNYETPENAFALALKHVEHQNHKENLDKVNSVVRIKESEVLFTLSEPQRRKLVKNGITLFKTFNYYQCHICKDSYQGLISIFKHIKTPTHIQKINKITDNKANNNPPKKQKVAGNNDNTKHMLNENNKNLDNVKKEISKQTNSKKSTLRAIESKSEQTINIVKPTISTAADSFTTDIQKINKITDNKDNNKCAEKQKLANNNDNKRDNFKFKNKRDNVKFKNMYKTLIEKYVTLLDTEENDESIDEDANSITITNEEASTPVKNKANINSDAHLKYNKDLLIMGPKYLSMCQEPGKKNIYNIDKEILHLMRFGLSMMFLSEAESYCFACDLKVPYDYQFIYDHLLHEIHIENLNGLSENHYQKEKNTVFTYLDLAKELMTEKSDDRIECYACKIFIPNLDDDIRAHKNLKTHVAKRNAASKETESVQKKFSRLYSDIWYYADNYYCKICNLYFNKEIKFAGHLSDSKHIEKVQSLQNSEEENEVETEVSVCHSCSRCWFGQADFSKHQRDSNHSKLKKKFAMFPKMKNIVYSLLNNIDNRVKTLIGESDAVAKADVEEKLLTSIEETVRSIYPNAKAYAFGSRSSYLGLNKSDVDVFLDCENNYNTIGSKEKSQKYINTVTNCFFNAGKNMWKKDSVLLNPRVPIIKLQHRESKIFCDISFFSGLGVEKTKLIKIYVLAYKHCREMILYLKKWFNASDLYSARASRAINSYAISWFVIFYLQIEGIFPSVYSIIKMNKQPHIVDGWECGFPETVPVYSKKAANKTLKDLLKGFFSYYTNFNYQMSVACPYLGTKIDKSQFAKYDLPHMNNYYNRLKTEDMEIFRFDSPMCIQDPVDHSQNISKAVTKYQLRCFRHYCFESSKKL